MNQTFVVVGFLLCAAFGGYCFYVAHHREVSGTSSRVTIRFLQLAGATCWVVMGFLLLRIIVLFITLFFPVNFASRP